MCMYTSSRGKSYHSYSKSELQMFSLTSNCHVGVPQRDTLGGTPIRGLHTELYEFVWTVSANNSRTVYCKDLRPGEVVYLFIFMLLNGFKFIF